MLDWNRKLVKTLKMHQNKKKYLKMAVCVSVEGPRNGGKSPNYHESEVKRWQWLVAGIYAVINGGRGLHYRFAP